MISDWCIRASYRRLRWVGEGEEDEKEGGNASNGQDLYHGRHSKDLRKSPLWTERLHLFTNVFSAWEKHLCKVEGPMVNLDRAGCSRLMT